MTSNPRHVVGTSVACAFVALAIACKPAGEESSSEVKTDLRDNDAVSTAFEAYQSSNRHCSPSGGGKRVLITGFGLFGDAFNISGGVTMSMAKPSFWPASFDPQTSEPKNPEQYFRHGETQTRNGGATVQRTLEIDNESFDVCFLYLDVKWDLAAAIIAEEARRFRPSLIVMSGMNGKVPRQAYWESGAINNATQVAGFNPGGARQASNIPTENDAKVLPSLPLDATVNFSWNPARLAQANSELIASINRDIGFGSRRAAIREGNNYICNNVSLAVTSVLSGRDISLAGGKIKQEGINAKAKVGFLHYPFKSSQTGTADDGTQIFGWAKVLANTIKVSIGSGSMYAGENSLDAAVSDGNGKATKSKATATPDVRQSCSKCESGKKYCGQYDFANENWVEGRWQECKTTQ